MSLDQLLDWNALVCMGTEYVEDNHFRFNCPVDRSTDPKDPDNIRPENEANGAAFAIMAFRWKVVQDEYPSLQPPTSRSFQ